MGLNRKKIYQCDRCKDVFIGRVAFDYHVNANKRTDPVKRRELPIPPRPIWYDDNGGNGPATNEGKTT